MEVIVVMFLPFAFVFGFLWLLDFFVEVLHQVKEWFRG
jgi:Na+-transporting methylmalonyl-CoA/oxaloacetate decarboxylase gamma subunit